MIKPFDVAMFAPSHLVRPRPKGTTSGSPTISRSTTSTHPCRSEGLRPAFLCRYQGPVCTAAQLVRAGPVGRVSRSAQCLTIACAVPYARCGIITTSRRSSPMEGFLRSRSAHPPLPARSRQEGIAPVSSSRPPRPAASYAPQGKYQGSRGSSFRRPRPGGGPGSVASSSRSWLNREEKRGRPSPKARDVLQGRPTRKNGRRSKRPRHLLYRSTTSSIEPEVREELLAAGLPVESEAAMRIMPISSTAATMLG